MMAARALASDFSPPSLANPLTETTMSRLSRALGPQKGPALADSVMRKMGIVQLSGPQELCDFANHLVRLGGVAEAVGRSLKVMALLRGATDRPLPALL